jgi:hypothetical protein
VTAVNMFNFQLIDDANCCIASGGCMKFALMKLLN